MGPPVARVRDELRWWNFGVADDPAAPGRTLRRGHRISMTGWPLPACPECGYDRRPLPNEGHAHVSVLLPCPGTSVVPEGDRRELIRAGITSRSGTTAGSASAGASTTSAWRSRLLWSSLTHEPGRIFLIAVPARVF